MHKPGDAWKNTGMQTFLVVEIHDIAPVPTTFLLPRAGLEMRDEDEKDVNLFHQGVVAASLIFPLPRACRSRMHKRLPNARATQAGPKRARF